MSQASGVRLAIDWGKARIGVAASDPAGILAFPVATVAAGQNSLDRLREIVAEYEPKLIYFGLPTQLQGTEGIAATEARQAAIQLASSLPGLPLRLLDERLTTVSASRRLREAGRDARRQRAIIDQAAAVALLEQALAFERSTGRVLGVELDLGTAVERTSADE